MKKMNFTIFKNVLEADDYCPDCGCVDCDCWYDGSSGDECLDCDCFPCECDDYCCWHPMYSGPNDYCACREYAEEQTESVEEYVKPKVGDLPF